MSFVTTKTGDNGTTSYDMTSRVHKDHPWIAILAQMDILQSKVCNLIRVLMDHSWSYWLFYNNKYANHIALCHGIVRKLYEFMGIQYKEIPEPESTYEHLERYTKSYAYPDIDYFVHPGVGPIEVAINEARTQARLTEVYYWMNDELYPTDSYRALGIYLNRLSDVFYCMRLIICPMPERI